MKLNHKCGRVISEASSELPGLSNAITSTKIIFQEARLKSRSM
jgi:hypothetical protein